MLHAWFSDKQAQRLEECGIPQKHGVYKVYATEDGKEVRATMVTNTKTHGCHFDDMKYLGQVERFLRCEK